MTMKKDFIKQFGKDTYKEVLNRAGCHSKEKIPVKEKDKFIFSLLEIIDWQCFKYGDLNKKLTEPAIKRFILEHKENILNYKGNPPSYLGIFAGAFSFLKSKSK